MEPTPFPPGATGVSGLTHPGPVRPSRPYGGGVRGQWLGIGPREDRPRGMDVVVVGARAHTSRAPSGVGMSRPRPLEKGGRDVSQGQADFRLWGQISHTKRRTSHSPRLVEGFVSGRLEDEEAPPGTERAPSLGGGPVQGRRGPGDLLRPLTTRLRPDGPRPDRGPRDDYGKKPLWVSVIGPTPKTRGREINDSDLGRLIFNRTTREQGQRPPPRTPDDKGPSPSLSQ